MRPGSGQHAGDVSLLVTRGFGSQVIASKPDAKVVGADTVIRMLERNARVATRYSGGFVESIDGVSGGAGSDWFYYVNGVQAPKGAAETKLHAAITCGGTATPGQPPSRSRRSSARSPSRSSTATPASAGR